MDKFQGGKCEEPKPDCRTDTPEVYCNVGICAFREKNSRSTATMSG